MTKTDEHASDNSIPLRKAPQAPSTIFIRGSRVNYLARDTVMVVAESEVEESDIDTEWSLGQEIGVIEVRPARRL